MKRYIKIWWMLTILASQIAFVSRFGAFMFVFGKILRFALFLLFVLLLGSTTKTIAGYTLWQVVFFFATFSLIDTLSQFFLREVYRFRSYVVSGNFDYFLTKPISPLFRSLFGGSDVLDVSMLVITGTLIFTTFSKISQPSPLGVILYIFLLANALVIALAFHIFVLSVGILTTEVDNTLFLYRDLTQMGRVPIDIYREPVGTILTFIIPVGIMITFPVKALIGLLAPQVALLSFFIGALFFYASLRFWKFALKSYSSASS